MTTRSRQELRLLALTAIIPLGVASCVDGVPLEAPIEGPVAGDVEAIDDQADEAAITASFGPSLLDRALRRRLRRAGVEPVELPPPQDPALVELGRNLFFDREIAGTRNIACSTCHNPLTGTADGQSQSRGQGAIGLGPSRRGEGDLVGVIGPRVFVDGDGFEFFEFLPRNALSLWNRGVPGFDVMFWDGRLEGNAEDGFVSPAGPDLTPQNFANALALFSIFPITPDQEMRGFPGQDDRFGDANEIAGGGDGPFDPPPIGNGDFTTIWNLVTARIASPDSGYAELLDAAFPTRDPEDLDITDLGAAMGAFQTEAFVALDTPFDRFLAGDNDAMSTAAKRGALLFYGRANCASCHSGGLLSDLDFHNIAAPQVGPGRPATAPLDIGRAETTGDPSDRFKFRTPPLRNVELEGPWFHNGAYASLEDAVRHHLDPEGALATYDDSQIAFELIGTFMPELNDELLSTLDPALGVRGRPLREREIQDLMAFLSALTDPSSLNMFDVIPDSLPSGLLLAD